MKKGGWIALGLLLIGCIGAYIWYQRAKDRADKEPYGTTLTPRLEVGSFNITDISDERIKMTMKLLIDNPLPVGFKAKRMDYAFYIDTALVMQDTYRKTVELEAGDSTFIQLPAEVFVKKLGHVLKELDKKDVDSTNYRLRTTFELDVPVLGQRTFTVNTEKKLPTVYLPKITVEHIDLGKFGLKEMDLAAKVNVSNRNVFPLNFTDTHYTVSIDGKVISEGDQPEPILIKKQAVTPVVFPVTMKPNKLPGVAWKALFEKKSTPYVIDFRCKLVDKDGNNAFQHSQLVTQVKGTLEDLKDLKKDK